MAGFVNRASGSNIAYHLYSSLGVGIGVTRTFVNTDIEIILQLWLIPREEKVPGINQNFRRGYTGAIIVIRGSEIDSMRNHLNSLNESARATSIIAVVGTNEEAIQAREILSEEYGIESSLLLDTFIGQAIGELGEALLYKYNNEETIPLIIRLDETQCPEYHYVPGQAYLPECTPEDIEYIKHMAERIGTTIHDSTTRIELDFGSFEVNLKNGGILYSPVMCKHCLRECKRESRICIIGVDRGWASDEIGDRALLIIAKIWAIASSELPQHVQKQIRFASQCREYVPQYDDMSQFDSISIVGHRRSSKKKPLLEEAGERVVSKRMSSSAFEVLKSKLQYIRSSDKQDGT
ncbi:MAG: hypothetical protein ACFFED_10015 [Candidatus Thorarchaeota archaeon]